MPRCLQYSHDYTGGDAITYAIFRENGTQMDDCGSGSENDHVTLTNYEYNELLAMQGEVATLEHAIASVDPAEISATFGIGFALIFSLAAVGYKIKVAKSVIHKL